MPVPVFVCGTCKDPVVPTVAPGPNAIVVVALFLMAVIPALLYLILLQLKRRDAVTCPRCGGREIVPIDSTRGAEILGDRLESVSAAARRLAIEAQREAQAASARSQRIGTWLAVGVGLAVIGAGGLALWRAHGSASAAEARADAVLAASAESREIASRDLPPPVAQSPEEILAGLIGTPAQPPPKPMVTIVQSGYAMDRPDGERVMITTAGERYVRGEVRDGWVRLADAPVEAWLRESEVRSD